MELERGFRNSEEPVQPNARHSNRTQSIEDDDSDYHPINPQSDYQEDLKQEDLVKHLDDHNSIMPHPLNPNEDMVDLFHNYPPSHPHPQAPGMPMHPAYPYHNGYPDMDYNAVIGDADLYHEKVDLVGLSNFLKAAPQRISSDPGIEKFKLFAADYIACVRWKSRFYISGTDIVRILVFRFYQIGRDIQNRKKFEEGVFSDLRNLKIDQDATLESPKSELLEYLFDHNCVRTKKKQKVFYWFSVNHNKLFLDALEREFKKENQDRADRAMRLMDRNYQAANHPFVQNATTTARRDPSISFRYDSNRPFHEQVLEMFNEKDFQVYSLGDNSEIESLPFTDGMTYSAGPTVEVPRYPIPGYAPVTNRMYQDYNAAINPIAPSNAQRMVHYVNGSYPRRTMASPVSSEYNSVNEYAEPPLSPHLPAVHGKSIPGTPSSSHPDMSTPPMTESSRSFSRAANSAPAWFDRNNYPSSYHVPHDQPLAPRPRSRFDPRGAPDPRYDEEGYSGYYYPPQECHEEPGYYREVDEYMNHDEAQQMLSGVDAGPEAIDAVSQAHEDADYSDQISEGLMAPGYLQESQEPAAGLGVVNTDRLVNSDELSESQLDSYEIKAESASRAPSPVDDIYEEVLYQDSSSKAEPRNTSHQLESDTGLTHSVHEHLGNDVEDNLHHLPPHYLAGSQLEDDELDQIESPCPESFHVNSVRAGSRCTPPTSPRDPLTASESNSVRRDDDEDTMTSRKRVKTE